jgi:hypothetical protein
MFDPISDWFLSNITTIVTDVEEKSITILSYNSIQGSII